MLKPLLSCVLSIGLATLSLATAQSARGDLFDTKKSQQELEVMRGILSTTLSFVLKELRGQEGPSKDDAFSLFAYKGTPTITSFYLYGQGAVFMLPVSSLRTKFAKIAYMGPEDELRWQQEAVAVLAGPPGGVFGGVPGGIEGGVPGGVAGGVGTGIGRGAGGGIGSGVQGAKPIPGEEQKKEELRKKLADAQEKVKKQREENEVTRAKTLEQIGQVKGYLIEALANHGDSLTQVKPNEYLNIVISSDDMEILPPGFSLTTGSARRRDVVSVQKSVIMEYKAGKLSMEAFKQKVLQYSN
jgi:hypothetical protein